MKPIVDTAFYCCGVRMDDAAQAYSICGDQYAKTFMCDYGLRIYDRLKSQSLSSASSIIIRHRIMDDLLSRMLRTESRLCVVTVGAGFDTRPFRLEGGTWFELDDPALITYKNALLPADKCFNKLHRMAIDYDSADEFDEKLDSIALISNGRPMVFVLEGVLIYLNTTETHHLLDAIDRHFPHHRLICDLVSRAMVDQYGHALKNLLKDMGAPFRAVEKPASIFSGYGYHSRETLSIVDMSVDLGLNIVPKVIWNTLFNDEVKGNAVYVWEKGKHGHPPPQT